VKILAGAQAGDRLVTTLFLAALFHGMLVLGVTFAPPQADQDSANPTLEVVLVADPDPAELRPERADYLAQANQRGAGTTAERVSPTSGITAPLNLAGDLENHDLAEARPDPRNTALEQLHSRASTAPTVQLQDLTDDPSAAERLRMMRLDRSENLLLNDYEQSEKAQVSGEETRELYVDVNTRQTDVAEYLDSWRRKIERVGTMNFPAAAQQQQLTGNPTLEVAVRADGTLDEIILRRSSGSRPLDRAALEILRQAAPFDPFPARFRATYDVLRFAYEWQFVAGQVVDSSIHVAAPADEG
jgi:protein TonB